MRGRGCQVGGRVGINEITSYDEYIKVKVYKYITEQRLHKDYIKVTSYNGHKLKTFANFSMWYNNFQHLNWQLLHNVQVNFQLDI